MLIDDDEIRFVVASKRSEHGDRASFAVSISLLVFIGLLAVVDFTAGYFDDDIEDEVDDDFVV